MKPQSLTTLTLLPPPGENRDEQAVVEEWARGLEWVRWLLGSVRARTEHLGMNGGGWSGFTDGLFRDAFGPALENAWAAAHAGDLQALMLADDALTEKLDHDDAQRSIRAGSILLKSTRQARYQGVLGHFRDQIATGRCSGHLATIWAATGHFFHLSLANVIAEYLRLEWEIGTRHDLSRREPNFSAITSELLLARRPEMRCV